MCRLSGEIVNVLMPVKMINAGKERVSMCDGHVHVRMRIFQPIMRVLMPFASPYARSADDCQALLP